MKHLKEDFTTFLGRMHMEDNQMILDDDIPDAFDEWLIALEIDPTVAYAEKRHAEQTLFTLEK